MLLKTALLIAALFLSAFSPVQAESTVLIGSCEALIAFAQGVAAGEAVSAHALLTANIEADLPLLPIGSASQPFSGVFDGQGHTISGGVIAGGGLFGAIAPEGEIRNLTLADFTVTGADCAGILAGRCAGSIESCAAIDSHVSILSTELWGTAAGGLCGSLSGSARGCIVSNCTVEAPARAGGLAGQIASGTMENCLFTGGVLCESLGDAPCGGLTGAVQYGGALKASLGSGTVNAKSAHYVGGAAGALFGGSIEGCAFSGDVESGSEYAGALSGWLADRGEIAASRYDGVLQPIGRGETACQPLPLGDYSLRSLIESLMAHALCLDFDG